MRSIETDYGKYISELDTVSLQSILKKIDKDKYSERTKLLIEELNRRNDLAKNSQLATNLSKSDDSKTSHSTKIFIITINSLALLSFILAINVYLTLINEFYQYNEIFRLLLIIPAFLHVIEILLSLIATIVFFYKSKEINLIHLILSFIFCLQLSLNHLKFVFMPVNIGFDLAFYTKFADISIGINFLGVAILVWFVRELFRQYE